MNLCDEKTVKRLMAKYGTGTKKSFGQNFLINPSVPRDMSSLPTIIMYILPEQVTGTAGKISSPVSAGDSAISVCPTS